MAWTRPLMVLLLLTAVPGCASSVDSAGPSQAPRTSAPAVPAPSPTIADLGPAPPELELACRATARALATLGDPTVTGAARASELLRHIGAAEDALLQRNVVDRGAAELLQALIKAEMEVTRGQVPPSGLPAAHFQWCVERGLSTLEAAR